MTVKAIVPIVVLIEVCCDAIFGFVVIVQVKLCDFKPFGVFDTNA